jgi:hypothetical protein
MSVKNSPTDKNAKKRRQKSPGHPWPLKRGIAMRHYIFELVTVTAIAAAAALGNVAVAAQQHTSTTGPVPGVWPNPTEWRQRHEGFVAAAIKVGVDVLFLGDSITDF